MTPDELNRLKALAAAATPKPLDDNAPKDRELIGIERPPFEDQNYFHMIRWNEERQLFMADAGHDWDTGEQRWAFCGVDHYLDPLDFPLLPEVVIEPDEWDEGDA